MTILPLSSKGTLRLSKDLLHHLEHPTHLQVRPIANGIVLIPVKVLSKSQQKAISEPPMRRQIPRTDPAIKEG